MSWLILYKKDLYIKIDQFLYEYITIQTWLSLQIRTIEQARPVYERLVTQFGNAGRYWKIYIEHEVNFTILHNCLSPIIQNLFYSVFSLLPSLRNWSWVILNSLRLCVLYKCYFLTRLMPKSNSRKPWRTGKGKNQGPASAIWSKPTVLNFLCI